MSLTVLFLIIFFLLISVPIVGICSLLWFVKHFYEPDKDFYCTAYRDGVGRCAEQCGLCRQL